MKTIVIETGNGSSATLKQDGEYHGFRAGDIVKINNLDATFEYVVNKGNAIRVDNPDATFTIGIVIGFCYTDGNHELPEKENDLRGQVAVWVMQESSTDTDKFIYFSGRQHAREYIKLIDRNNNNNFSIDELGNRLGTYIKENSMSR